MDSALEDINKTIDKLESTMVKAETVFDLEQRKIYKRLLNQNCSPSDKVFTPGFIHFISNILKGKSTSEARRYLRQETQDKENGSLEDEIQMGFSLIDSPTLWLPQTLLLYSSRTGSKRSKFDMDETRNTILRSSIQKYTFSRGKMMHVSRS